MLKRLIYNTVSQRIYVVLKRNQSLHTYFYSSQNVKYNQTIFKFHTSSKNKEIVTSIENNYALHIVDKIQLQRTDFKIFNNEVTSLEDFNKILHQNWRNASSSEIVNIFTNVTNFCVQHNINLSDERFDNLVDGVMDNCEHFTEDDIMTLLNCMIQLPLTPGYDSHNFHDLWSCLDDICCWKMVDWEIDTSLEIGKLWSRLHLGRLCDYIFVLVDRLARKADKLNKNQLVAIFYFFNVCRIRAVDFEYEYALEKLVPEMNVDELAIVALGYFKTKTKIKLLPIMKTMVEKVEQNSEHIHEISLTAILKILRFSNASKLYAEIDNMLGKLSKEIPRVSELCCLHIALLGTGYLQFCHPETLKKVCEKIVMNISNPEKIRLKDIERILLVLTMFDFDPKTTPDIFKECYVEIHKESRLGEEIKYARALVCALFYLSIKNMYSYELMSRVLDPEYIENNYGKAVKYLPRELFVLDCSIDIECPDYNGTRLTVEQRYRGAKWLTEFPPTTNYKLSLLDKFFLNVLDTIKETFGENSVLVHHILPHFAKADIILCKNKQTGEFIEPLGFERYVLGDIMFPLEDNNLEWFVFVMIHWSNTIRNTNSPLGHVRMKMRQLQKIGYKPILIVWKDFEDLPPETKKMYILEKMKC